MKKIEVGKAYWTADMGAQILVTRVEKIPKRGTNIYGRTRRGSTGRWSKEEAVGPLAFTPDDIGSPVNSEDEDTV